MVVKSKSVSKSLLSSVIIATLASGASFSAMSSASDESHVVVTDANDDQWRPITLANCSDYMPSIDSHPFGNFIQAKNCSYIEEDQENGNHRITRISYNRMIIGKANDWVVVANDCDNVVNQEVTNGSKVSTKYCTTIKKRLWTYTAKNDVIGSDVEWSMTHEYVHSLLVGKKVKQFSDQAIYVDEETVNKYLN